MTPEERRRDEAMRRRWYMLLLLADAFLVARGVRDVAFVTVPARDPLVVKRAWELLREEGCRAISLRVDKGRGARRWFFVYATPDGRRAAARLSAIYSAARRQRRKLTVDDHREIGLLLGYRADIVEEFVARAAEWAAPAPAAARRRRRADGQRHRE